MQMTMPKTKFEKTTPLLEYLANATGCNYISDLLCLQSYDYCVECIKDIPAEVYEVKEWNEAITYLTQEPAPYTTSKESKAQIIEILLKK